MIAVRCGRDSTVGRFSVFFVKELTLRVELTYLKIILIRLLFVKKSWISDHCIVRQDKLDLSFLVKKSSLDLQAYKKLKICLFNLYLV